MIPAFQLAANPGFQANPIPKMNLNLGYYWYTVRTQSTVEYQVPYAPPTYQVPEVSYNRLPGTGLPVQKHTKQSIQSTGFRVVRVFLWPSGFLWKPSILVYWVKSQKVDMEFNCWNYSNSGPARHQGPRVPSGSGTSVNTVGSVDL